MYNVILRRIRSTIVAVKSNGYYTISVVFVALVIQHAMRVHHIVFCAQPLSTTCFPISRKQHDFRGEKKRLNIKFISSFSLQQLCLQHISF